MFHALIAAVLPTAAACEDLAALRAELEGAFAEARLDDAATVWASIDATLACAPVSRGELARLELLHGAVLLLHERDPAGAGFAFAAARALDPTAEPDLGDAVRQAWVAAPGGAPVELRVSPVPVGWSLRVDGTGADEPLSEVAGIHLVQLVDPRGVLRWGDLVMVATPGPMEVALPPFADAAPPPEPAPRAERLRGAVRISGASLAGLGAAAIAGSIVAAGQVGRAADEASLDAAWDRQVGLGVAGLSLLGAGAVGVGVSFVR